MNKAVLFVTFNRLDYVKETFEQIRIAKPPRFYVASDGPRDGVEGEAEKIQEIRDYILNHIDWDCEVKTRFLEKNSGGSAYGVSNAVTWLFENEEDGIILEDDCVPNQSFFRYCEELLDKYKDDKRIWHIAGDGFCPVLNIKESYYFAKVMHCWGWASWADRWKYFTLDLSNYDEKNLKHFSKSRKVQNFWKNVLDIIQKNPGFAWDYQWGLIIAANKGYCINPVKNLVSNIGVVGEHYSGDSPELKQETYELKEIIHPKKVEYNDFAVNYIYEKHFGIKKKGIILRLKEKLIKKQIIKKLIKKIYKKQSEETKIFMRYKSAPRFQEKTIKFKGLEFIVPDLPSFAYQVKDIFLNNAYKFNSYSNSPLIYDCGANIGTSILFFKLTYPNCRIKAFESDPKIFRILKNNISKFPDVELYNKAVWINNDDLLFSSQGADGGSLINQVGDVENVKGIRLKELLQKENSIDLLKIDIEGAEVDVIQDCKYELKKIKNIFIEYHSIVGKKQELNQILEAITNAGFRYYLETISAQNTPLVQIDIHNNMDLQVNIWGYR